MSKTFTARQVSRHNTEKDLWIIYKDGVYDLTKFLKEHPGGEEVLVDLAGTDATKCFDEIGHTTEAIQLRETYKIGTVDNTISDEQQTSDSREVTTDDENWEYQEVQKEPSPLLTVVLAAGALVYAVLFYYFWFS